MIEKFGVKSSDGKILISHLGLETNMYNNREDEVSTNFFNSKGNGVRWINDEKEVAIFPSSGRIIAYPTPDFTFVVVIYHPMDNPDFAAPNNAVIYNKDGSIHHRMKQQKLVSDLAKKHLKDYSELFESVYWAHDKNGNVVMAVEVGFNRDLYECRIVDTNTGELLQLLNFGAT
ncbi:MAG: hypothetical protein HOP30_14135 [Cyclobacteriaceae bacterium]|nr:hypothetical protein [Cyclobacteriaceae bacterium]